VPEVSVIMPVRNAAAFVEEAARSILSQTFRDLELIVIDDCSSDESAEIVDAIRDNRVRLFRNDRHTGLAGTLNKAFEYVTGRYVARMDADDISLPRRIETQVEFLNSHADIGVCGSWAFCMEPRREYLLTWPIGPKCVRAFMLFGNPLAHPTVCIRTEAIRKSSFRFDETFRTAQDYDLWQRMADDVAMDNIPQPLLRYRIHQASTTQSTRPASDRAAGVVRRRELKHLGVEPDEVQLGFHGRIGTGDGMKSRQELGMAEDWILKLIEANGRLGKYNVDGLQQAAAFAWFRVCMNSTGLGPWIGMRYLKSELRHGCRPAGREIGRFIGSLAMKSVFRREA
jgi:glycosyltransferase involved in cell wall biosynthesis